MKSVSVSVFSGSGLYSGFDSASDVSDIGSSLCVVSGSLVSL